MEKTFNERVAEARQSVSPLAPKDAAALGNQGNVVFVDPRPAQAIADTTGLITGARNIPLDDIARGALPEDLDRRATHVITACQGGPMGAIAAHEFQKLGFAQVNYVDGGTQAWLDAGFTTSR